MRKYDSYKDSGIEWLGEIPGQWEVKRLKDLGNLQNGISNGKEYFGFGYPFVSYGNVYNDSIRLSDILTLANSNETDQKAYSVLEGDVFFTRTSETIDEIGIASTCLITIPKATFSGFTIRLRPKKRIINKQFSKYFFRAHINRQFLSKEISLVTRASLSQNLLNNLPVLLPNIQEQTAIAQYLDTKTQAIDMKVNFLEKKIGYYKGLRKSIINETVTKGLDKTVKPKDSGIDWIGQIPEHWDVKRFKDSFDIFTGNSISDKTGYENPIDAIPYVATKDINFDTGQIDFNNGIYISKSDNSFKKTKSYTSLICIEGANAGKKIGFTETPVSFVNKLCAIKGKSYISDDKYNFYYLNSVGFSEQFFALISGLIGGVSINKVKEFLVLLPPKAEQTQIATYLDHKTQTIDKIVGNIQNQISTLKELRKTLINDVVTGKIKVVE